MNARLVLALWAMSAATAQAQFADDSIRLQFEAEMEQLVRKHGSFGSWTVEQRTSYVAAMTALVDEQDRVFGAREAETLLEQIARAGVLTGTNVESLRDVYFEIHVQKMRDRFKDFVALLDSDAGRPDAIAGQSQRLVDLARSGLALKYSHVPEPLRERALSEFGVLLDRDASTAFRPYGNVLFDESQWGDMELSHWRAIFGDDRRQRQIDAAWERVESFPEGSEGRRGAEVWLHSMLGSLCNPLFYDARNRSEGPLSEPTLILRTELERQRGDAREEFERKAAELLEREMVSWLETVRRIQREDRANGNAAEVSDPAPATHPLAEWGLNDDVPARKGPADPSGIAIDSRNWIGVLIVALVALVLLGVFRRPLLGIRSER